MKNFNNNIEKVNPFKPTIVGIDEAGRGPLAGPVVAGAVIIPNDKHIDGLNDSKKLTSKERERLSSLIKENFIWGLGFVNNNEIDSINILQATFLAMERAVNVIKNKINAPKLHFMIDGNIIPPFLKNVDTPLFGSTTSAEAIVKGDSKIPEIMAASILAKTERDKFMKILGKRYSEYGFEKHMGYGTKAHIEMLKKLGPTPYHRMTFKIKQK